MRHGIKKVATGPQGRGGGERGVKKWGKTGDVIYGWAI